MKIRKIASVLLAATMVTVAMPLNKIVADFSIAAAASEEVASGECGETLTWTLDGNGTLTISGEGEMYDWESQSDVPWDSYIRNIVNITLENGITSIGDAAFNSCRSLTSVTIPDSVISIGEQAFSFCRSLTSVTIPYSVTSIGWWAFSSCDELTSITIENPECEIYDSGDTISDTATICGYECGTKIYGYEALTPQAYAQKYNRKFESLGDASFVSNVAKGKYGENITWTLDNESTLTISGEGIMNDWLTSDLRPWRNFTKDIVSIVIEDGVTSIGNLVFAYCENATTVTIPESVLSIGLGAFANCNSLTSITIENPECEIYDYEKTISDTATIYGYEDSTAQAYAENYDRKFVNIDMLPAGKVIWEINEVEAHPGEEVILTLSVKDSDGAEVPVAGAQYGITAAEPIDYVTAAGTPYGNALVKNDDTVEFAWANTNGGSTIVEDGEIMMTFTFMVPEETAPGRYPVELINKFVSTADGFDMSKNIIVQNGAIIIPDEVTTTTTTKATTTTTKNKTTTSTTSVADVTTISKTTTTTSTTSKTTTTTTTTTSTTTTTTGANEIIASGECGAEGDNLTWTLDGNGTLTISGEGEMYDWESQSDVPWCNNKENIKEIVIDDGVAGIGDYAFYFCKNLTSITIPNSVVSLGDFAFWWCQSLASITIPDSVTSIGSFVFHYCTGLNSIIIPNSVTNIGIGAFSVCENLTSIIIPDSVTNIEKSTLSRCEKLDLITIENPECEIYDSEDTISDTATIYGYEGSTAQTYAEKYNRKFVCLGNMQINMLGDINEDGKVDARDASSILSLYADISSGGRELTDKEKAICNVNGDASVDARDASVVLAYYADLQSGSDITLEEFLNKEN